MREAAVLIPILRDPEGELRVLLVIRTDDGGLHGGQLGVPGGKPEAGDADLLATALRETEEEIGVPRDTVEVLAPLPALATLATGWRVHPFLGKIPWQETWQVSDEEIAGVLTPAVAALASTEARATLPFTSLRHSEPLHVEGIEVSGHVLWGMTLRLLDDAIPRILAAEWPV